MKHQQRRRTPINAISSIWGAFAVSAVAGVYIAYLVDKYNHDYFRVSLNVLLFLLSIALVVLLLQLRHRPSSESRILSAKEDIAGLVTRDWITRPTAQKGDEQRLVEPSVTMHRPDGVSVSLEFSSTTLPRLRNRVLVSGAEELGSRIVLSHCIKSLMPTDQDRVNSPIPIVLHARLWLSDEAPGLIFRSSRLEQLVEAQLESLYHIDRSTAKLLIRTNSLIFCLQGLDAHRGYVQADEEKDLDSLSWNPEKEISHLWYLIRNYAQSVSNRDLKIILTVDEELSSEEVSALRQLGIVTVSLNEVSSERLLRSLRAGEKRRLSQFVQENLTVLIPLFRHINVLEAVLRYVQSWSDQEFTNNQQMFRTGGIIGETVRNSMLDQFKQRHRYYARDRTDEEEPWAYEDLEASVRELFDVYNLTDSHTIFRADELSPHKLKDVSLRDEYCRCLTVYIAICITVIVGLPNGLGTLLGWYLEARDQGASFSSSVTSVWDFYPLRAVYVFLVSGIVSGFVASIGYVYSQDGRGVDHKITVDRVGCSHPIKALLLVYDKFLLCKRDLTRSLLLSFGFSLGRFAVIAFSPSVPHVDRIEDAVSQSLGTLLFTFFFFLACFLRLKDDSLVITVSERKAGLYPFGVFLCSVSVIGIGLSTWMVTKDVLRAFSLSASVLAFSWAFFATHTASEGLRIRPNRAIWYSAVHSCTMALICASACALAFYLRDRYGYHSLVLAYSDVAQSFALFIVFIFLGGLTVLKHWAVRRILRARGLIPRRLLFMMEQAARIGLLNSSGGGFMIADESIFEYLRSEVTNLGVPRHDGIGLISTLKSIGQGFAYIASVFFRRNVS